MKREAATTIGPQDAGQPLLEYLSRRFTYHDRERWQELIRTERVRLNDRPTESGALLCRGDTLAYVGFDQAEPPVSFSYTVRYEDRSLLVIDKPGNLPCHPGGRYFRHTLWYQLKNAGAAGACLMVNRLDRETSGLVVVAKTAAAAADCGRQFAAGQVRKRYLAVVEGLVPSGTHRADGVMGRDAASPVRKKQRFLAGAATASGSGAASCRCRFRRLRYENQKSLVLVLPLSGRLHQIRATLCSLGYPVVGDKLYGPDDALFLKFIEGRLTPQDRRRLVLGRQALHAQALGLRHPDNGRELYVTAPLPADMAALFGRSPSA